MTCQSAPFSKHTHMNTHYFSSHHFHSSFLNLIIPKKFKHLPSCKGYVNYLINIRSSYKSRCTVISMDFTSAIQTKSPLPCLWGTLKAIRYKSTLLPFTNALFSCTALQFLTFQIPKNYPNFRWWKSSFLVPSLHSSSNFLLCSFSV
jgi:hypothetical protein